MKNYLRLLADIIGPQYGTLFGVFLLFIVLSFIEAISVGIVIPLFSSIDFGTNSVGSTQLQTFAFFDFITNFFRLEGTGDLLILMAIIFFVKAILGYYTQRTIFKFGYSNQKRLTDDLVVKYQKLAVSDHSKMESSELIQNLIVNVEIIMMGSIVASIKLVSEIFVVLSISVVLFIIQPVATIVMFFILLLIVITYSVFFRDRIQRAGKEASESRVVVIKNFQALMHGFKEVHVIGMLGYFNNMIFDGTQKVKNSGVEYKSLSIMPRYIVETVVVIMFAVIFFLAESFGISSSEILSLLAVFGVASMRLIPGINQITASIVQMSNSSYALKKVHEGVTLRVNQQTFRRPSLEKTEKNLKSTIAILDKKIVNEILLSNVQFTHAGNKNPVLSLVNLDINKGELVCFRGESGAGKSTMFDLLLNFYHPEDGLITANGVNIKEIDNWVSFFTYVPQESFLFSGTVRDNITLGLTESGRSVSVGKAMDLACISDFIESLPEGLETILGERGVNISGGQRQRIALARAFFLDRPIMLLDEPTSALDFRTSSCLIENIIKLRKHKTIIISSHDKNVISICDRIYLFNNGTVSVEK